MKRLMNPIQLYKEGDHHLPATCVIMRSGRSIESKSAYLLEQNVPIEENMADAKGAI